MNRLAAQGTGHMITRRAVADASAEQQTGYIRRLSLDEIEGDWVTVAQLCRWAGCSRGTGYALCRSGILRGDIVRFGRGIRVRKAALARLIGGEK